MDEAWNEMKQSISLANRINKTDEDVDDFHAKLKGALAAAEERRRDVVRGGKRSGGQEGQ